MGEKHYVQYDPATGEISATLSVYADDAAARDTAYQQSIASRPVESLAVADAEALPDPAAEKVEDGKLVAKSEPAEPAVEPAP